MIIERLRDVLQRTRSEEKGFLRNLLKEELQLLTLEFIYNKEWANLIFKGGSCLRICFGLNRLSEDLDFDYEKDFSLVDFFNDLINYFQRDLDFQKLEFRKAKERLYLKFPVLRQLGLVTGAESDKLYIKIELSQTEKGNFKTELQPIFTKGVNFLLKRYDLPTLMAGKINALLSRVWFKGKASDITVKGRDYYDLLWYMEKKVEPNYDCIRYKGKNISSSATWQKIEEKVSRIEPKHLEYDLLNLIESPGFVKNFSRNYKTLFTQLLNYYIKGI